MQEQNSKILKTALLPATAAFLFLMLSISFDKLISKQLIELFALKSTGTNEVLLSISNCLLAAVYAGGGFVSAMFLRSSSRLIVLPQLMVLSAILIFPFAPAVVAGLKPLMYLALGLIGYAFGLIALALCEANESLHTQQVESALRNRQLLETRLQLIKQDEIERKMLAADLHDQVLNDLKLLLRLLEQNQESVGTSLCKEFRVRIDLAMENIRKVMESLCPSDLEHIGLLASLEECLIDRADKADFIPQFRSSIQEDEIESLNRIEKALLYRLVQESITNICKHAQAKKVRLSTEIQDGQLRIKIQDDGTGIDPDKIRAGSRGLQYMRLRAEIIGAMINWSPGPEEKGTLVEIRKNLEGRAAGESTDR